MTRRQKGVEDKGRLEAEIFLDEVFVFTDIVGFDGMKKGERLYK